MHQTSSRTGTIGNWVGTWVARASRPRWLWRVCSWQESGAAAATTRRRDALGLVCDLCSCPRSWRGGGGWVTPFWLLYALQVLLKPMPGNPMAPSLAESWTVSPDQKVYELNSGGTQISRWRTHHRRGREI